VHSTIVLLFVGSLAFFATMVDNLFAFAAQLALTPRERFAVVSASQSMGVAVLAGLAVGVGTSLDVVPLRWVSVLALAPWGLAWHQWRQRDVEGVASVRRGVVTTFVVTIALGGDNLAVWIPLLRANGAWHEVELLVVFALWQSIFVALAWSLAAHPRIARWTQRGGAHLVPWLYVVLGVAILFECHLL
jgi:cadmium resistance protein CadD (predicted permease)